MCTPGTRGVLLCAPCSPRGLVPQIPGVGGVQAALGGSREARSGAGVCMGTLGVPPVPDGRGQGTVQWDSGVTNPLLTPLPAQSRAAPGRKCLHNPWRVLNPLYVIKGTTLLRVSPLRARPGSGEGRDVQPGGAPSPCPAVLASALLPWLCFLLSAGVSQS